MQQRVSVGSGSDHSTTPQLAEDLVAVANRFTVLLRASLRESGVTVPQARALSALFIREPQRISALANSQQVTQPAMTSLVKYLVRHGYVARRQALDDRRAVEVSLTPAGRELMQTVRETRVRMVSDHIAELSGHEFAVLRTGVPVLGRLTDAIRRERHA